MRPTAPFPTTPLWREGLVGLEMASLVRSGVFRGEGVTDGRGQPVLLIPGFLAGDGSLGVMTRWLRRNGYHTRKAGMRTNVDCSARALGRLESCLEALVERQGRPAAVIGQSRGGSFAKVLAQRRPELVSGIVTLGTPQLDPLAVHPFVAAQIAAVGALGSLRVPGLFSHRCLNGDCCESFWDDFAAPLNNRIPFVSVYSRRDGIVDWRACLDPSAEHVEIESSHCGMAVSHEAYGVVAAALPRFRAYESRRRGRRSGSGRGRRSPRLRDVA